MILQDTYEVKKADIIPVEVSVPGSKSITNRALLIAALANGKSVLKGVLFSDDSRHFLQALQDLGFVVEIDEPHAVVSIEGKGGRVPKTKASVDVGSAGTAARFLTAYLGLCEGEYHMNSSEQMKKRPMEELLQALQDLGAEVTYKEALGHFPFAIGNSGVNRHEVTIDVEKSSQFLSALLISSVLFQKEFRIHVKGHHGMAYVEMTVAMMKQFGVEVQRPASDTFVIAEHAAYQAREYQIEPDVSAASYLHVLEQMGCRTEEEPDGIRMYPPTEGFLGGVFDFSAFSDQALTLAAIACFASETVEITGIGHIRYQECDRFAAILTNLKAMGIACEQLDENRIVIHPGKPHGCKIKTFEDHRVAMAFAIPGLVTDGIVIENPSCCRKTFENYFEILDTLCK